MTSTELPGGRASVRGSLKFDYQVSRSSPLGSAPFYALLMAAMCQADTANTELLKQTFPDVWEELQERYNAPAGLLVGEANALYRRTEDGIVQMFPTEATLSERRAAAEALRGTPDEERPWCTIHKRHGDYELLKPDGTNIGWSQTEKSGVQIADQRGYFIATPEQAKRLREQERATITRKETIGQ